jgi:hypothetical protein
MPTVLPSTFLDAVQVGLSAMTPEQRVEFEQAGFYADPHTKYRTNFDRCVAEAVGLSDGRNESLLRDVALTRSDELHFLEVDDGRTTPQGALRVVLSGIAAQLKNSG